MPLSDAEAIALAEDASLNLGGVALGDDAWSLACGKNVSLYCNGKEVTPEEDSTLLGSNQTKVPSLTWVLYVRYVVKDTWMLLLELARNLWQRVLAVSALASVGVCCYLLRSSLQCLLNIHSQMTF